MVDKQFCHYHPQRQAITICERCNRPICFDDKRLYRYQESSSFVVDNPISGIGENTLSSGETLDYCILCNASALRTDINPLKVLFYILPYIAFVIIISFVFPPSTIIFGVFTFVFLIIYIAQVIKARKAEDEAMLFKKSLKEGPYASTFGFLTSKRGITNIDNSAHISIYSSRGSKDRKSNSSKSFRPDKQSIFHIVCYECGKPIELADKFCTNCGDSTADEIEDYKNKKPEN